MLSLARFSIRRPKQALAGWLVVAITLTLIGLGVSRSLSPSVTVVPGTQSARAQQLANAQFGPTQLIPILLEGPNRQLDHQGPGLVRALAKRPHTRVLSAWDAGPASAPLRARPSAAMIVVSVDRAEKDVVQQDEPQIESLVAHRTLAPVKAYITGQPSIDRGLKDASLASLRQTELIAAGLLFLLLLTGLRAPVAALVVTAVGAISMLSGFGEVALLGHVLRLDPVGVALGTVTGLALGVGFALLVLDRFHREAQRNGLAHDVADAAIRDLRTTGRAVLVGGGALVLALALIALVGPTQLMVSLGTGMLTCAAFATGGAVVVMPAALVLLGHRINALSFPAPAPLARLWARALDGGNWVTRHAVYAGFAATAVLAAIAVPALALNSGPPDVSQLPSSAKARVAFEEVSRVMGPGWATPYNLIVVARNGPITTPAMLGRIQQLETRIAKDRAVDSVTGPGAVSVTSTQLSSFWPQIKKSAKISDQSKKDLLTLITGLGQAGAGSNQLQAGLEQASSGATRLHGGSRQAQSGAGQLHTGSAQAQSGAARLHSGSVQAQSGAAQLHNGLAQARAGSEQLSVGLSQALAGATALKAGAGKALSGSSQLAQGIGQVHAGAGQSIPALNSIASLTSATSAAAAGAQGAAQRSAAEVSAAQAALGAMTSGKTDSHYAAAVAALENAASAAGVASSDIGSTASKAAQTKALAGAVATQAPALVKGVGQLQVGAAQLEAGIRQLRDGNAQLATGMAKLAGGGSQLTGGLSQLTGGAGQLQTGLAQLANGTGQLEVGLVQLTGGSGQLETGLSQLTGGTGQLATGLASGVGPAGQLTTGLGAMQAAVAKARGQIPSTQDLYKLERQSPHLFDSGYFVLAAVEGAPPAERTAATFTLNLLRGGSAGQIVVVSKYKASDRRTAALGTRLAQLGQAFGRRNGAQVAVGGPAGNLGDLTNLTKSRVWLDVAILAASLTLALALAVRALLLPAVATAFSLLVTAASFAVLQLLFGGSNPPLGGPGYLDPMSILGIFTVAFGISVLYAALLLMRTREAYLSRAGARGAVRIALRDTAAAATGAGLVMIAAVIPFLASGLVNVRQFGIGVAMTILLEIALVRPVLLPAAESLLGRFGWWPTRPPQPAVPARAPTRRRPWPHLPRRRPRPAHPY